MLSVDKNTIQYIKQDRNNHLEEKKCIKSTLKHSCEFMLDFRTCLNPLPEKNTKIKEFSKITAQIEKVCKDKVIISGILHKTICYTAARCECACRSKHIKHIKIPFSCFIDVDWKDSKDTFEIVDYKILCNHSKIIRKQNCCLKKAILSEKDIIKITVERKSSNNFYGNTVVDSEICFVPSVDPDATSVSVDVNPKNFKVLLMCCDLIIVSGFITKTVTFNDGTPTAKKDILVQVNVPANIKDLNDVDSKKWEVTRAEICDGCFYFTSPNEDATLFHTLLEKDILAVEVSHKHKCQN